VGAVIDITSVADMIIIVEMHEALRNYHRRYPGWAVDVRATANRAKHVHGPRTPRSPVREGSSWAAGLACRPMPMQAS
jgi:hypothetical protein